MSVPAHTNRALLTAVLIVRDEAEAIERTLRSIEGVCDRFVVLDTGSRDGTQDRIKEFRSIGRMGDVISGRDGYLQSYLFEEPFVDYATARNRALDLAAALPDVTQFALVLSADEIVSGGASLRGHLAAYKGNEDAFFVRLLTEQAECPSPRVLRLGSPWRYEGLIHEIPVHPDGRAVVAALPDVVIQHTASDPERRLRRLREVDLPLLKKMLAEAPDDGRRARALLLLAQTNEALAHAEPPTPGSARTSYLFAALALYLRRMELGGAVGELQHAQMHILNICDLLSLYTDEEMVRRLTPLVAEKDALPEVHFMLAAHLARLDVRQALPVALRAASIAVEPTVGMMPSDRSVRWRSFHLAAECARVLKQPQVLVADLLAQARAAGAPASVLAGAAL